MLICLLNNQLRDPTVPQQVSVKFAPVIATRNDRGKLPEPRNATPVRLKKHSFLSHPVSIERFVLNTHDMAQVTAIC